MDKCARAGCFYPKCPDKRNNGGTHCCFYCKTQSIHGPKCVANADVMPIPELPVLNASNKEMFQSWHEYYERVYGHPVEREIDLNKFTWFYWHSPLGYINCLTVIVINTNVPNNFPFVYGHKPGVHVQEFFLNIGFFVRREKDMSILSDPYLEVHRASVSGIEEIGVAWFFVTVGSGFLLASDQALRLAKNRREFPIIEEMPFWAMKKEQVKILVYTESEWWKTVGLIELIYRLEDPKLLGNIAPLPMYHGSKERHVPYVHKYSEETKCLTL